MIQKKPLRLFAAAILLCSLPQILHAERDSAKLLTIGNSFAENAVKYLPEIAEAGGKTLVIGKANLGGCTLERHAKHLAQAQEGKEDGSPYTKFTDPTTGKTGEPTSLIDALKATDWDFVTIQQHSWESTKPESYQPFADQLIAAIRQYAPSAEILVQETWAYNPEHSLLGKNGMTQEQMYGILATNYRGFADGLGLRILPSGDAFHQARQMPAWAYAPDAEFDFENATPPALPDESKSLIKNWGWSKKNGKQTLRLDGKHANDNGCYLLGCVWYLVIFDADSIPDSFTPKGIRPDEAASLREAALQAVLAERERSR